MAPLIHYLADFDLSKEESHVVVRVNRRWSVMAADNPSFIISIEMILMDAKGHKIHATVRTKLVKKYENVLMEGQVYSLRNFALVECRGLYRTTKHRFKIIFQLDTKAEIMPPNRVSADPFFFVPFPEIICGLHDSIYLIDVMAMLIGFGNEKEVDIIGNPSKRIVIELENSGVKMDCILWGPYVEQLISFLDAGDTLNTVIVIYAAKIKDFRGKLILQNSIGYTAIEFNPNTSTTLEFRKSMLETNPSFSHDLSIIHESSLLSLEDDFLLLNSKMSILELKDTFVYQDTSVIVYGRFKHFIDSNDWWYTSCICGKVVLPDLIGYYCPNCKKRVFSVKTRYRLRFKVMDDTASTTLVVFDPVASILLGKTCDELLEKYNKVDSGNVWPSELAHLVDKKNLFKIEVKADEDPKNCEPFYVKRITADEEIIRRFTLANPQVASLAHGISENIPNHLLVPNAEINNAFDNGVSDDFVLTPTQRDCAVMTGTSCNPKFLKPCKIEK